MKRPGKTEPHHYRRLLALQLLILIVYPYFDATRRASGAFSIFVTGLFLVALRAVADGRRSRWLGIGLAVPAIVGLWWPGGMEAPMRLVGLGFEAALCFYVTVQIARDVFQNEEVTEDTLSGAVCIYIFLGLAWAAMYNMLEWLRPASFAFALIADPANAILWDDLLYFSFTTLTTTGYGDITPATASARSLALLEHLVGVLYMAILVARLVALYRRPTERRHG